MVNLRGQDTVSQTNMCAFSYLHTVGGPSATDTTRTCTRQRTYVILQEEGIDEGRNQERSGNVHFCALRLRQCAGNFHTHYFI